MQGDFEFKTKAHKPYYRTRVRRNDDEKRTNAGIIKLIMDNRQLIITKGYKTLRNRTSNIVNRT